MNWRARSGVKLEPRSHNEVSSRVSRGIWGQAISGAMLTIAVVKSLTKLSDCGVVLQSKLGNPQVKLIRVHTSVDRGTYLAKATSHKLQAPSNKLDNGAGIL